MTRLLFLFIISISLNGCIVSKQHGTVDVQQIFVPEIKIVTTANIGQRMLFMGKGWDVSCITPLVDKIRKFSDITAGVKILANIPLCSPTLGGNNYFGKYHRSAAPNDFATNSYDSQGFWEIEIVEKIQEDGTSNFHQFGYGNHYVNYNPSEFKRHVEFKSVPNSFQQTIEYMGTDGSVVRFLYSEFSNDFARPAFNREFSVDLTKGKILNFKGAVVEIISVTNTEIKYKVLKYFE